MKTLYSGYTIKELVQKELGRTHLVISYGSRGEAYVLYTAASFDAAKNWIDDLN